MTNRPGWYPPGQVCYPPELPASFKNVYSLKPIIGVPSDEEVIGIHAVIHAANRISGVPGMHDPGLFMKLADHLFSVQMARYRSKYSLVTFPSNASYTPPTLPAHVPLSLEVVAGVPSDEEIIKVQDAVRAYQHFSNVPSMFDSRVNMELSQHLFDIQMAKYMRHASEIQPNLEPQTSTQHEIPAQITNRILNISEEKDNSTNNAGTGGALDWVNQPLHSPVGVDVRELMERSNQLAERSNQLLERSNELFERSNQPTDYSNQLTERSNQALDRFSQLIEKTQEMAGNSEQPINRFNQLFERFNQLLSELSQPMQKSNQLAERLNQLIEGFNQPLLQSNELFERANQLAEQHNQSSQRSSQLANQLAEQANKPVERLENVMKNINRVLMGIQHAIVRASAKALSRGKGIDVYIPIEL